jgi:hypothetical protein
MPFCDPALALRSLKAPYVLLMAALVALSPAHGGGQDRRAPDRVAGAGYVTTASGLQYLVIEPGTGPRPAATDVAVVNYTGRLLNGTVFDSHEGGEPVRLPIDGLIAGVSEALSLMRRGATYRLRIPPELAYGAAGAGDGIIPPNATLEFDVTLVDFFAADPNAAQRMTAENADNGVSADEGALSRRAGELVAAGDCAGAERLALVNGDFDLATTIRNYCAARSR